jgi:hypothetical protein
MMNHFSVNGLVPAGKSTLETMGAPKFIAKSCENRVPHSIHWLLIICPIKKNGPLGAVCRSFQRHSSLVERMFDHLWDSDAAWDGRPCLLLLQDGAPQGHKLVFTHQTIAIIPVKHG